MTVSVEKAGNYLSDSNLEGFGNTLDETWQLKKSLSNKISASQIDDLYELARRNGAWDGKLLGAGGGGFLLFYSEPKYHDNLRAAHRDLKEVKFNFDQEGSKIFEINQ